jgi:hypothetical protein
MYGSTHNALPVLARATVAWIEPALFIAEASTNLLCSGTSCGTRAARDHADAQPVLMAVRIVQTAGPGVGPVLWIVAESALVYTCVSPSLRAGGG